MAKEYEKRGGDYEVRFLISFLPCSTLFSSSPFARLCIASRRAYSECLVSGHATRRCLTLSISYMRARQAYMHIYITCQRPIKTRANKLILFLYVTCMQSPQDTGDNKNKAQKGAPEEKGGEGSKKPASTSKKPASKKKDAEDDKKKENGNADDDKEVEKKDEEKEEEKEDKEEKKKNNGAGTKRKEPASKSDAKADKPASRSNPPRSARTKKVSISTQHSCVAIAV